MHTILAHLKNIHKINGTKLVAFWSFFFFLREETLQTLEDKMFGSYCHVFSTNYQTK